MDVELMRNCLPDRALASTSCMFLRTCSDRQKEVFPATWKATWTGTAMSVDLTMIFIAFVTFYRCRSPRPSTRAANHSPTLYLTSW